jgi:Uncharacterized protein conserved in bacteria
MLEELEIEFKLLISKEVYNKMILDFEQNSSTKTIQKNYYFDTKSLDLKDKDYSLRVREIENTYQLTLKKPVDFSKKEYNEIIDQQTFNNLKNNKLINSEIFKILKEEGFDLNTLIYYCSLTTKRIEIPYQLGILCLDKNYYFNKVDYELEFEAIDELSGKKAFLMLVNSYNLNYKKNCISKISRAFKTLNEKNKE